MTKTEIYESLKGKVSNKAIVLRDNEYVIQGKFSIVSPIEDNLWDCWICNPKDLHKGLGQRKVHIICNELPVEGRLRILDGEAYTSITSDNLLLNLKLLGIRKKREVSEKEMERLRNRFAKKETV